MLPFNIALGLIALLTASPAAAEPKTVDLSQTAITCLLEHREAYMTVPRAVVIFTPDLCPALSRAEVIAAARAVQNAEEGAPRSFERVVLNKPSMACLFDRMSDFDPEEAPEDPDASVRFVLDCSE